MTTNESIKTICSEDNQNFLSKNSHENPEKLALKHHGKSFPTPLLVHQIKARQKFATKFPSWVSNFKVVFPKTISLEQSSSEATANYKRNIIQGGESMADLTGGMGVDFFALSQRFVSGTFVDAEEYLVILANHNFQELGLSNVKCFTSRAEKYLKNNKQHDLIYLDPHRRDTQNKKLISFQDCTPNILEIKEQLLNNCKQILIKASPMIDIKTAIEELQAVTEVHVVSVKNECKEVLFLLEKNAPKTTPTIFTVNIKPDSQETFQFTYSNEFTLPTKISPVKDYIFLPNTSILKSGGFKSLAEKYDLSKLEKNSHIYTKNELVDSFPGRSFEVIELIPYAQSKKRLKQLGITYGNIIIKNFPEELATIRKKINIKKDGKNILIATTEQNRQHILLLVKQVD